jgi:hypothetical protein
VINILQMVFDASLLVHPSRHSIHSVHAICLRKVDLEQVKHKVAPVWRNTQHLQGRL